MRRVGLGVVTAVSVAVLGLSAGCSLPFGPDDRSTTVHTDAQGNEKHVDEGPRDDASALAKMLPALGDPTSATWYTGTIGASDDRVPGPSLRWYDAVVELEPETAQRFREETDPAPATGSLNVIPEVAPQQEDGPFVNGKDLNEALSTPGLRVYAWLASDGETLVLTALPT